MGLQFCTLASSSKGNSIYIGTDTTKILIDAGISCKRLESALSQIKVNPTQIDAIFITHEHTDHTKGMALLSKKYNIPIYATRGSWNTFSDIRPTQAITPNRIRVIQEYELINVGDMNLYPFPIPHDAEQPVGYAISCGENKVCIATDLGHIPANLAKILKDCDIIMLESNHDIKMLRSGSYPEHLKQRVLSKHGHICNEVAGQFLCTVVSARLKYVVLGHLSQENNCPRLASEVVHSILRSNGHDVGEQFKVMVAPSECVGNFIELD